MRLLVAGSRHIHVSHEELRDIINENIGLDWVTEIVSGGAVGVDRSAEEFAKVYGIKLTRFPAGWLRYGKGAGPKRNLEMAIYSDSLLLIWDGISKGSKNMKARMIGNKKPVYEIIKRG